MAALSGQVIEPPHNLQTLAGPDESSRVLRRTSAAGVRYVRSGTAYTDTLAAGARATLYGGSAQVFDTTRQAFVTFILPANGGSAVLYATPERNWAAVAAAVDAVPLDLVVLHEVRRFQLRPLGAVTPPPWTRPPFYPPIAPAPFYVTIQSDAGVAKALSLWTGSANTAPPANWEQPSFSDAAWSAAVATPVAAGGTVAANYSLWSSFAPLDHTEQALIRQQFTLSIPGAVSVQLTGSADDQFDGIWINGTLISGTTGISGPTVSISPSLLFYGGGANLIAAWGENLHQTVAGAARVIFSLSIEVLGEYLPVLSAIGPTHGPAAGGSLAPTLAALSPTGGPASGANTQLPVLTALSPADG